MLIPIEQVHIDKYLPLKKDQLFNFLYLADSSLGYSHSAETKEKIRANVIKSLIIREKLKLADGQPMGLNGLQLFVYVFFPFFNDKKKENLALINDQPFTSRQKAIDLISLHTIKKYIDTNTFYLAKNNTFLYFSSKLLTAEEKLKVQKVQKVKSRPINQIKLRAKQLKIGVYVYDSNLANEKFFISKSIAARALNISITTITKFIDTNNCYSRLNKILYFSSKPLTDKKTLINVLKLSKHKRQIRSHLKIYVYNANLRLINNKPFPSIKNGITDSLKISTATVRRYIDTNKFYLDLKEKTYYYFSRKLLTEEDKIRLQNLNVLDFKGNSKISNAKPVWVYRKSLNGK